MSKYNLVIRNDKLVQYDRFALFIMLLNTFVFVYQSIIVTDLTTRIFFIAGAVLVTLSIGLNKWRNKGKTITFILSGLVACVLTWLMVRSFWAAFISLTLLLLYRSARRPLSVTVYDDRLVYHSFPQRVITWQELNNVVLKDGLLTVDLKNNRIIQTEILNSQGDPSEAEFNEFCRQRMVSAVSTA